MRALCLNDGVMCGTRMGACVCDDWVGIHFVDVLALWWFSRYRKGVKWLCVLVMCLCIEGVW